MFRHFLHKVILPNRIISFDFLVTLWTNRFKMLFIHLLPVFLIRRNFPKEGYFDHTCSQNLAGNNSVNSRGWPLLILISIPLEPSQVGDPMIQRMISCINLSNISYFPAYSYHTNFIINILNSGNLGRILVHSIPVTCH